jgi:hypothetical protein
MGTQVGLWASGFGSLRLHSSFFLDPLAKERNGRDIVQFVEFDLAE